MTDSLFNVKACIVTSGGGYLLDGGFFEFDFGTADPDEFVKATMLQYEIEVQLPVTWNSKGMTKFFSLKNSDKQIYFVRERLAEYSEKTKTHEKRKARNGWGD